MTRSHARAKLTHNPRVLIAAVRREGRAKLLEHEALHLCESYGIPVPRFGIARSSAEAVEIAEKIRYPVVHLC